MIGKLTGSIASSSPDGSIIVDVSGVGYCVRVPLLALPLEGTVSLFIHTAVREDAIDLYGFPNETGLIFFKQLMSVSGIGPKTAISIMGVADVASLSRAIAAGDAQALVKVYGLGKKSAERIVVELRDKLAAHASPSAGGDAEVVEALMALGYSAHESRNAIQALSPKDGETTKQRLSAALRRLGQSARV